MNFLLYHRENKWFGFDGSSFSFILICRELQMKAKKKKNYSAQLECVSTSLLVLVLSIFCRRFAIKTMVKQLSLVKCDLFIIEICMVSTLENIVFREHTFSHRYRAWMALCEFPMHITTLLGIFVFVLEFGFRFIACGHFFYWFSSHENAELHQWKMVHIQSNFCR